MENTKINKGLAVKVLWRLMIMGNKRINKGLAVKVLWRLMMTMIETKQS